MVPTKIRIFCINKTDRTDHYDRIKSIGGLNPDKTRWKLSEDDAIRGIEEGKYLFYTEVDGKVADILVVRTISGKKYLKTAADGNVPDNLLSLPECP